MKRVLTELTQECELTAQMYISGLEKKEIASLKYKAVSTINNQLQEALSRSKDSVRYPVRYLSFELSPYGFAVRGFLINHFNNI